MIKLRHKLLVGIYLLLTSLSAFSKPLDQKQVNVKFYFTEGPFIISKVAGSIKRQPSTRTLSVQITNKTNKAIRIPTEMLSLEYSETDSFFNIFIIWIHPYPVLESNFVVPESKICIAELRENESVGLMFNIADDWPVSDKQICLSMNIPKKIWERYNLDYFNFIQK